MEIGAPRVCTGRRRPNQTKANKVNPTPPLLCYVRGACSGRYCRLYDHPLLAILLAHWYKCDYGSCSEPNHVLHGEW